MDLYAEEPELGPYRGRDDPALRTLVRGLVPANRPVLVLVDGRSGAGKTTAAGRLAAALDASVVHTDDVAWNHARFGWEDLLVTGVLEPWRRGEAIDFRPPAWVREGREGSVRAPAGRSLVVEGVGAAREALAPLGDLVVWVQADHAIARPRGLARDASYGTRTPVEAEAFWDDWMTEEDPFLAADRPWTRADLVVLGTPPEGDELWVAQGPAGTSRQI